jgi:hypothetical protein
MVQGGDQHIRIGGGEELLVMRAREAEGGHPSRLGRLDADTASVTPKHSSGGTLSSLHAVRNISGCGFPCAKSRPDISASKTPGG